VQNEVLWRTSTGRENQLFENTRLQPVPDRDQGSQQSLTQPVRDMHMASKLIIKEEEST
jgi:hypothetical protein